MMNILNVRFRLEKVQLIVFHYELPSISQSKVKKSFQKLHNIIQNHIDYKGLILYLWHLFEWKSTTVSNIYEITP